jgi:hypothetical protein
MKNKLPNIENLSRSELVQLESEVKKLISEKKRVIEFSVRIVSNTGRFTDHDLSFDETAESLVDTITDYYDLHQDESVEIFDIKEMDAP